MQSVYVLKGSRGSWDDWTWFILGIFTDIDIANQEKEKFVQNIKTELNKYSQDQIDLYEDFTDEYEEEEWTPEVHEYFRWKYGQPLSCKDINLSDVKVVECKLDEISYLMNDHQYSLN